MIHLEHYQNARDILDNNSIHDDGRNFKISYEYEGKYFTINMRYFIQDEILFGFINFNELNQNFDKCTSYLVGYIIEMYILSTYGNRCSLVFYVDKNLHNEFYHLPTLSFSHVLFYNDVKENESQKYKFYKVSRFNLGKTSVTNQYLIDYLDEEL